MINFSLDTCWRLIPTNKKKEWLVFSHSFHLFFWVYQLFSHL